MRCSRRAGFRAEGGARTSGFPSPCRHSAGLGRRAVAFTLQTAAYVNALGQVELIFSLLVSVLVFSETVSRREWQGLIVLAGSMLLLLLLS